MSDKYTPTTEQVRATYLGGTLIEFREEGFGRFQRWLAEVERAAAAKALEDAAREIYPRDSGEGIRLELRARAEAYRREGKG